MARADILGFLEVLIKEGLTPSDTEKNLSEEEKYNLECNKIAYNQMILCCEGRAFAIVHNAKSQKHPRGDAALAWKNLKKRFQIETTAGKLELKLNFCNLKLQRGQDPDEWLLQLDLLRIHLEDMGSKMTDEDYIAHVLNNLTPDYSELITSLEGTLEQLKIDTLKERVLSFYRRKYAGSREEYGTKALLHIFKGRCNNCGEYGYKGENCHQKKSSGVKKCRNKEPTCHYCKKPGHIKRNCYKFKKEGHISSGEYALIEQKICRTTQKVTCGMRTAVLVST